MTALASVQTAADASALTWGYVLGAFAVAAAFASPFLLALYRDSDFHRRGVARRRAHRQRQEIRTP
jgi:hypothetical protein